MLIALEPGKDIAHYNIQVWNMDSGLPGNAVFALRQTSDGYLWIGTQDGLVRFDGIHFEVFTSDTTPQLKSNDIRALYEDSSGCLWIGAAGGGLIRFKDGEFTAYPAAGHNIRSRIMAIDEDRWGNLWIGSNADGLACLKNGKFTTYTTKNGLPGNQVRFIYKDENRDLWAAASAGIVKLTEPGNFQTYAPHDVLPYKKTACLYETNTGNLWIGTGESGLFKLKNGVPAAYKNGAGIISSTINTLYKDRQANVWIGTDKGGLIRLNGGGVLACGSVYAITEDSEGSLWAGTLDRGLYRLSDNMFTAYTAADGLSHNIVHCIYEDREGIIWIGTDVGLDRIKSGKPSTVSAIGQSLLNNPLSYLFEDSDGYLWIGAWSGLHRYKDGKLTTLTRENGLSDNRVTYIIEDKHGYTWIGTENGLNRYDRTSGKFELFTTSRGLSGNSIGFIFEDRSGELWVGTDAGLDCISGGIITTYRYTTGDEDYSLICAYEDKEGTLWLGTERGLIRAKGKGDVLDAAPAKNTRSRLTVNAVWTILEDDRGYLWLGGRKGISRAAKKELNDFALGKTRKVIIDTYSEKDGMKSHWVIGPGCKTSDGRLWFPTSMGLAVIDPNRVKTKRVVSVPIIEKFVVDGESIKIKSFDQTFSKGGRRPQPKSGLELTPGKKRLDIYYTSISFIDPQRIRFKVKLEGYDMDWVAVGNLRNAAYNGLAPGRYTFKVSAGNQDGIWNPEAAAISFYLRPYFYQTAWFYIIVVLFVSAAVFSFYRIRVGRLKTREKELNELVRLRTAELEKQSGKLKEMDKIKSRFFANISHEFRTPLTLILGPLEQMLTSPQEKEKEQKKKMRLMLRNSRRLLGLINQLLELSRFDSGAVKLQVSRQNIVPFLKGILHSFDSLAVQKELELIFQTEAEDITLFYDPVKMEEVIVNLMSNAIKFTPAGGRITLAVEVGEAQTGKEGIEGQENLQLSVSDTGPGIPREELAHIFDRFYQADSTYEYHRQGTGIGLAIAREIVELHHGTITAYSPGREGSGTLFIIRLPMEGPAARGTQEGPADHLESRLIAAPAIVEEYTEEEVEAAEAEEETWKEQEKEIILVVEDSADVRQYIRGALVPQYIVKEAKDGDEGLSMAGEIVPDLIICDVMMPGKDGFEVCRGIKNDRITSHIPVILLTAKAGEENIIQGLESGADDYITKPFNTRILIARIKNLIELRRQFQQNLSREMTLKPVKNAVSNIDREFLRDLQAVIDENISDIEFNVEELSRKIYMSHANLYRKIHALTGENPTDFIRSCRLKRGAEMLKNKSASIVEVALEVGFSSAAYFTKCFKERFHQLPSEYQAAEMER